MTLPPIDPDRWRRVQELFVASLERPAADRADFLVRAEPDAELRAYVAAMLDADADPATVLAGSAEEAFAQPGSASMPDRYDARAPDPDPMIGARVGPYLCVERIGEGGMGTVYLAEHEGFEHRVALKVIRKGMASEEVVRRFAEERQILARLAHPNIARLLDGGRTEEGLLWFSLELVEGEPIDRHCTRHGLSVEDRLALFETVCHAVQYAHANLVVHRDLKPGNIFVDQAGTVKLLDFGIAKVLTGDGIESDTGLTRTGARPMSPRYATPEQVRGEPVTTATDVYSLGVVLYELIAGRGPYGSRLGPRELEDAILTTTPPPPTSTATRRGPRRYARDLDNITMTALRKEPERRYASAGAFAEDIRRLLTGHPVHATRDSTAYRLGKFVGRNRATVAATAAGLLLTAASVGWYTAQVRRERAQARLEADKAEQVAGFLQSLFERPDPMNLREDAPQGLSMTAGELLENGAARVGEELADQPVVRASLLSVLGSTYRSLGAYRKSVDLLEQAQAALTEVEDPEPLQVAQVANALGNAYRQLGDLDRAEAVQRAAYERILAMEGPDGMGAANVGNDLAVALQSQGRFAEAEPLMRAALRVFRRTNDPDDPALAIVIANHALILRQLGRIDEAEALYLESIERKRRSLGPMHPSVANSLGQLGSLLLEDRGDAEGAEALYREALEIRRSALGARHPYVAVSMNELAGALRAEGELDDSEAMYRSALALRREVLEPGHPFVAYSLVGLAEVLIDLDRPTAAEPLLREALQIREVALPADHWLLAETMSRLGRCLVLTRKADEGRPLLREGAARLETALGPDDRRTVEARERLSAATDSS